MATARDLIRRSLQLVGVLSESQTPTAGQLQDGLSDLNEMLQSWSTENLTIFSKEREEFTLPSGNGSPTMGPTTGIFTTTRPLEVEAVTVKEGTIEVPVEILSFKQWSEVSDKSQTSSIPTKMFPDYTNPLVTLNFWPVPSESKTVVIYSRKALTTLTADTVLAYPPGYSRAIRYNLAIEMSSEYNIPASAEVLKIANESKASIKKINSKARILSVDPAITARGLRANIFTGE